MFFYHSSLMTSDGDQTTQSLHLGLAQNMRTQFHQLPLFQTFIFQRIRLFSTIDPSLAQLLQALLQEIDAIERQGHIHRQRELLSDAPGRAGRRSTRIGGVGFEDHDLGRITEGPSPAGLEWPNPIDG